jgi:hypothetical protein
MKKIIGQLIFIASVLYIVYAIVGAIVKTSLLKAHGKCIKAVLIPELTSFAHRYTKASLVYEFTYEGKTYSGNSLEKDVKKIGDTVCVVYLPSFPSITRALSYFDSGEIKCDCGPLPKSTTD